MPLQLLSIHYLLLRDGCDVDEVSDACDYEVYDDYEVCDAYENAMYDEWSYL
jgi:hypothetical protein